MKNLGALLVLALALTGCGMEQVEEGSRGIRTSWGKVEGEPLSPGLQFYNPIGGNVFEMSVREEILNQSTAVFTRDTQSVQVQFSVTYYPDPKRIGALYSQFGKDWQTKTVLPAVLGSLKDAIGQYIADELVGKRELVKGKAEAEVKAALAGRDVIVTRLDLTNLDFDDAYEQAVEAKVVAVQNAMKAKNQTVQVEEQARQTVATAKADSEAMRIKSQALSQNKGLVAYEAVAKWDGKLPQIIMGGQSMPMLDLGKIMKDAQ